MLESEKILKILDKEGNLAGVIVPANIWAVLEPVLAEKCPELIRQQEDHAGFIDLMRSWNFRYPYDPAVSCPNCGESSPDWRKGDGFYLVSASFGGLLVFHCKKCGATIRHKYFKDHMTVECSPANGAQC